MGKLLKLFGIMAVASTANAGGASMDDTTCIPNAKLECVVVEASKSVEKTIYDVQFSKATGEVTRDTMTDIEKLKLIEAAKATGASIVDLQSSNATGEVARDDMTDLII